MIVFICDVKDNRLSIVSFRFYNLKFITNVVDEIDENFANVLFILYVSRVAI